MKEGDKVKWTANINGNSIERTGEIFKTFPKYPFWLIRKESGELCSVNKKHLQLCNTQ